MVKENSKNFQPPTALSAKSKQLTLPSPVNASCLKHYLDFYGYDQILTAQLFKGFDSGFKIAFFKKPNSDLNVKNSKSTVEHKKEVQDHINKELNHGRICGPFNKIPFDIFQISPIGLVPKKDGSFRMIVNLSSPKGASINDGIPDSAASVSYTTLSSALKLILKAGKDAFLAKSDIKSAFRLLPLSPEDYHLLCFMWEKSYFYDRCLPMGARSSCALFEMFSSALEFLVTAQGHKDVLHYLDDFIFIHSTQTGCLQSLECFKSICKTLNVPLAEDKTVYPTQKLQFLGFEINTCEQFVCLPHEKITKGLDIINNLLNKAKCTLKELQELAGFLNFATTVIMPGRVFMNRFYGAMSKLKLPYHRMKITKSMRRDLLAWKSFFLVCNGKYLYRDELFLQAKVVDIFTDASQTIGFAAVCDRSWFAGTWPSLWWKRQNIFFLELIPIWIAFSTWATKLTNSFVKLHVDNLALVYTLNKQSSKDELVMDVIRKIVLLCLNQNIMFEATHIAGLDNSLADSLSRGRPGTFFKLKPDADINPTFFVPLEDTWRHA